MSYYAQGGDSTAVAAPRPVKGLKGGRNLAAKSQFKPEKKLPERENVFSEVKGEKGAFIALPDGGVANFGGELELKEKLIANMMLLYSAILDQNLLKKIRGKRALYRRVALIAAAVLAQLYGDVLGNLDIRLAARLWGAGLADLLGHDDEEETYIDPLTGEVKKRKKRRKLPRLEVFFGPDGKMYVITDAGEKMELFKDPKAGDKLFFRTKSGQVIPVPEIMELVRDRIDGKLYLQEKHDPGMEVFIDPLTGKMFIRTKDGKKLEVMRDPNTGKLMMRTESGRWVELPDDLQLYTDPVTGKMFIGRPPPPPPTMEIFTDPITGKRFIRTENGEVLELVQGEDGKWYVRTESGNLRALPDDMQVYTDPVTGKTYIGGKPESGAYVGAVGDVFEMFTDPETGKTYIRTKDGQIMEIYIDPETGKAYLRTKSGKLKELPAGMEIYTDPETGQVYLRQTKDPGLEIFTDPLTGKMYVRTKDGEVMEVFVGKDGKTYFRTKSGRLQEVGGHLEIYVDPVTGKMFLGERRNQGMEVWTDEDGKTWVKTADGQILEMWTDPATGKTYLRTKSGRIVQEVDDSLVMYTDPKTGKKFLASRPGAQRGGIFRDPLTGKIYLRTESGRIVAGVMDTPCDAWPNALKSRIYLRSNSGKIKDLPPSCTLMKDPTNDAILLATQDHHVIKITNGRDLILSTSSAQLVPVVRGGSQRDFVHDLFGDEISVAKKSGAQETLVSDGSVYYNGADGMNFVRTRSGRLHQLQESRQATLNQDCTQIIAETKDGALELGEDVLMFTDPNTGQTYMRTAEGKYIVLNDDLEVKFDAEDENKMMFVVDNGEELKECVCEMPRSDINGKAIVIPGSGCALGFELYEDPGSKKLFLRPRDDALDDIDLSKLSKTERARIEALRGRRMRQLEKKQKEEEVRRRQQQREEDEAMKQMDMDQFVKEQQRRLEVAEKKKEAERAKKSPEQLRAEREAAKRAEQMAKIAAMEGLERRAFEELQNEYYQWTPNMWKEVEYLERQSRFSKAFLFSYFEVLKMTSG